jgi:Tfp pilus assembly protein PilF
MIRSFSVACILVVSLAAGLAGCSGLRPGRTSVADASSPQRLRKDDAIAAFEARRDAAQIQAALDRWEEGNFAACGALLRGVVERNPQQVDARLQLAEWLLHEQELDEAQQQARAALILAPERADVHDCLGRVLEATGQVQAAYDHFRRAAELSSQDEPFQVEPRND